MSVLIDVVHAVVGRENKVLLGKLLSRPTLLMSDGDNLTYAADVDIGQKQIQPGTGDMVDAPLRNVPIAAGNHELIYADVGAAVTLTRQHTGRLEITGFAKSMPGHYWRVGVTLPRPTIGIPGYFVDPPVDVGLYARTLTYDEIGTIGGGWGICPYGAYGIFRGNTLLEVRV